MQGEVLEAISLAAVVGPRDGKTALAGIASLLLSMPLVFVTDSESTWVRYVAHAGIGVLWLAVLVLAYLGSGRARHRKSGDSLKSRR